MLWAEYESWQDALRLALPAVNETSHEIQPPGETWKLPPESDVTIPMLEYVLPLLVTGTLFHLESALLLLRQRISNFDTTTVGR
jgi:hypothetical protein